jgi:arylsulfatase A-like enzyme
VLAVLAAIGCERAPERPRSVVCLVVDTLRADHLGAYGYRLRATSPRLDTWLARARVFERAQATSPWTLPSMASLFTARWPVHHGVRRAGGEPPQVETTALPEALPTLAERLRAAGFDTAAIVNNAFLAPSYGIARGFEHYDFQNATISRSRRAGVVVQRTLAWLDQRPDRGSLPWSRSARPFLLLVHFFDPHLAYDAPPPFRGRYTEAIPSRLRLPLSGVRELRRQAATLPEPERRFTAAAYDEEVAYAAEQLAVLLDGLQSRGWLRETLVVLTADHGEELFEHGGFEHGHALWQELLHVPLAFWGPGVLAGREPTPVSLVDLAPTVLDALAQPPLEPSDGISLWPNLTRAAPLPVRPLFSEGLRYGAESKAVLEGPHKLIWLPELGLWRHFDLSRDPGESSGGEPPATPELRALRETAQQLWAGEPRAAPTVPLDAQTREALTGLGYVD